ncbi:hypothetical protein SLEP1_g56344 [Rubroshorea leprosula]|uniref:Uncharacterized protein n=1 Tax=Rubroshorea leprosula TaxID=152421 RepID=A0AAV5MJE1_9ROSI|nr:hypothetical protein SLEP1_g56344 [Rubroshorea leprosula]
MPLNFLVKLSIGSLSPLLIANYPLRCDSCPLVKLDSALQDISKLEMLYRIQSPDSMLPHSWS